MEHFVRVILEKQTSLTESLDESVFPGNTLLETINGNPVVHIPLDRELTNEEADKFADLLSAYMFENGYDNFDIEISTNEDYEI
jgi:hypothetical protein